MHLDSNHALEHPLRADKAGVWMPHCLIVPDVANLGVRRADHKLRAFEGGEHASTPLGSASSDEGDDNGGLTMMTRSTHSRLLDGSTWNCRGRLPCVKMDGKAGVASTGVAVRESKGLKVRGAMIRSGLVMAVLLSVEPSELGSMKPTGGGLVEAVGVGLGPKSSSRSAARSGDSSLEAVSVSISAGQTSWTIGMGVGNASWAAHGLIGSGASASGAFAVPGGDALGLSALSAVPTASAMSGWVGVVASPS